MRYTVRFYHSAASILCGNTCRIVMLVLIKQFLGFPSILWVFSNSPSEKIWFRSSKVFRTTNAPFKRSLHFPMIHKAPGDTLRLFCQILFRAQTLQPAPFIVIIPCPDGVVSRFLTTEKYKATEIIFRIPCQPPEKGRSSSWRSSNMTIFIGQIAKERNENSMLWHKAKKLTNKKPKIYQRNHFPI